MDTILKCCVVLALVHSYVRVSSAQSTVFSLTVQTDSSKDLFRFNYENLKKFFDCLCSATTSVCTVLSRLGRVHDTVSASLGSLDARPQSFSTRYLCRSADFGKSVRCERLALADVRCSGQGTFTTYTLRDQSYTCDVQPLEVTWAEDQELIASFDSRALDIPNPRKGECTPATVSTEAPPTTEVITQDPEGTFTNSSLTTSIPDTSLDNRTTNATKMQAPQEDTSDNTGLIVGVAVASIVVVILCGLLAALLWSRKRKKREDKTTNPTRSHSFVSSYSSSIYRPTDESDNTSHLKSVDSTPVYLNTNGEVVYSNTKSEYPITIAKIDPIVISDIRAPAVTSDPNMNTIFTNDSVYLNNPHNHVSNNRAARHDVEEQNLELGNPNYSEVDIDRTDGNASPCKIIAGSSAESAPGYEKCKKNEIVYTVVVKNRNSDQVSTCRKVTPTFQLSSVTIGKDSNNGPRGKDVDSSNNDIVYSEVDVVDNNVYNDVDEDGPSDYMNHAEVTKDLAQREVTKSPVHRDSTKHWSPIQSVDAGKFLENDEGYATVEPENNYSRLNETICHVTDPYNCAAGSVVNTPLAGTLSNQNTDIYSLAKPIDNPRVSPVEVIDVRPMTARQEVKGQGAEHESQPMGTRNVYFELEGDADTTVESMGSIDLS